jgi:hypothetical protein
MQACNITWVVLMNYFLDSQAEKMSGGKDLKHNIGHIHPLEHSIGWLRLCSCELCIVATGMKAFQSIYSRLMPDGLCSTLFVLVDVGILCLAGKQRQRLRGLE